MRLEGAEYVSQGINGQPLLNFWEGKFTELTVTLEKAPLEALLQQSDTWSDTTLYIRTEKELFITSRDCREGERAVKGTRSKKRNALQLITQDPLENSLAVNQASVLAFSNPLTGTREFI